MINMGHKILVAVADREMDIHELVKYTLMQEGYTVKEVDNGSAAIDAIRREQPDLVLLDRLLPVRDGLAICQMLKNRDETSGIATVMFVAGLEELEEVLDFNAGADEYLIKPFTASELALRVKAVLLRSCRDRLRAGKLTVGKLRMDFACREAYTGEEKMELTRKEFELLKIFVTNADKAFTREQLLQQVWGYADLACQRTIDVHIRHLRAKLHRQAQPGGTIETVRTVGYRFRVT